MASTRLQNVTEELATFSIANIIETTRGLTNAVDTTTKAAKRQRLLRAKQDSAAARLEQKIRRDAQRLEAVAKQGALSSRYAALRPITMRGGE
ncbi:MAG: hypothetical protein CBB71_00970 [Rhodopirellula sp. TMED11]|nr:MAG: hypothetical protein CBB71_00970 [Rhodopirellula sp. TMED11]